MVRDHEVMGSNPISPTIEKCREGRWFKSTRPDLFMKQKRRIHVYYEGSVHGVGFRFTAEQVAGELGLTGWVKNLRDGRVEVVAEADERNLNEFINKIQTQMGHYIKDTDLSWEDATGEFTDFEIAFF